MSVDATFAAKLTKVQFELRVYIAALTCDLQYVEDILQETNVYILRKADTYDSSRPFLPWAKTMAKYQVLRWRKDRDRDKLVLDETALDALTDDSLTGLDHDLLMWALRRSLRRLTEEEMSLLRGKYARRKSVRELAEESSTSEGAVASRLFRIRKFLHDSISAMVKF